MAKPPQLQQLPKGADSFNISGDRLLYNIWLELRAMRTGATISNQLQQLPTGTDSFKISNERLLFNLWREIQAFRQSGILSGGGADLPEEATLLEMEAGTETELRSVSPALIAAAIAALAPAPVIDGAVAGPRWTFEIGNGTDPTGPGKFTTNSPSGAGTSVIKFYSADLHTTYKNFILGAGAGVKMLLIEEATGKIWIWDLFTSSSAGNHADVHGSIIQDPGGNFSGVYQLVWWTPP